MKLINGKYLSDSGRNPTSTVVATAAAVVQVMQGSKYLLLQYPQLASLIGILWFKHCAKGRVGGTQYKSKLRRKSIYCIYLKHWCFSHTIKFVSLLKKLHTVCKNPINAMHTIGYCFSHEECCTKKQLLAHVWTESPKSVVGKCFNTAGNNTCRYVLVPNQHPGHWTWCLSL